MLMVAGQAIHGERDLRPMTEDNLLEKADQFQNLFAACMLAAEFSREAALAAALRYDDTKVRKGATYLYNVLVDHPDDDFIALQGSTGLICEEETYPKIENVEIYSGENAIDLLWDRDFYRNYYSAFNVFRSDNDGKSWRKINSIPVSTLAYKDDSKYVYRDSVDYNYKSYLYRIEGLTAYATTGPLSDDIKAQAVDRTRPDAPYNIQTDYLGNGRMKISWEVSQSDKDIVGFRISKSNEIDQGFVELTSEPLAAGTRSFVDENFNELNHNYYFIGIFDKEGNVNVSSPVYAGTIDSIPPAQPVGLEGEISKTGVVTLRWRLGEEKDLKGYYVYFSNNEDHTFHRVTPHHVMDTVWQDSIPLKVLTKEIHYKVVALDHRSNHSPYSDMLTLKKPDIVPPASPVFIGSRSLEEGIELQWYSSPSDDVADYSILRKEAGKGEFAEIKNEKPGVEAVMVYVDKDVVAGKKYEYKVQVTDDAGLSSETPGVLRATAYIVKKLDAISGLTYRIDEQNKACRLSWKFPLKEDVRFVVYRSLNESPYITYKTDLMKAELADKVYKEGETVKYRVKAVNLSGWQSDFSDELIVKW